MQETLLNHKKVDIIKKVEEVSLSPDHKCLYTMLMNFDLTFC